MSLISIEDAIDSAIQSVKQTYPKECPRCHLYVQGEHNIERLFGWRRSNGKNIPQSYCRKCRSKKFNSQQQTLFEYDLLSIHSIKEAKQLKKNFNVEGIISQKNYVKNIEVQGKTLKLCSAILTDSSNDQIEIFLLGDDVHKVKNLSKIRLINGIICNSKEKISITTGKLGRIDTIYEYKRRPVFHKIHHNEQSQQLDDSWIISENDSSNSYMKTSDSTKFDDMKF